MEIRDFKLEMLKQEIEILVERINHFDDLRHRTKQMAITLWVAAIGFGLSQNLPWVLALAAFIPIPFWIQDTFYNAYQSGFEMRFWAIREFVRDGQYNLQKKKIVKLEESFEHKSFGEFPIPDYYGNVTIEEDRLERKTKTLRNFFRPKMLIFYLPLVIVAILIALLAPVIRAA